VPNGFRGPPRGSRPRLLIRGVGIKMHQLCYQVPQKPARVLVDMTSSLENQSKE